MPSRPLVLSFAASDPTCGAGLQADVLAIAAMGCHPLSVLTAFTIQDTSGVESLHALDPEALTRQARCLLAELPVGAFKLGVLGSAQNARAVAQIIGAHPHVPVVLDPVLASGRGDPLASDDLLLALRDLIVPRAALVKPNSLEARRLGGPRALLDLGARYVLVTGAHEPGAEVINTLYGADGSVREDRWARLPGSYHGSGCTLASAIAAAIARGATVPDAALEGQAFTWEALSRGFRPGRGQFIPDRFFAVGGMKKAK